MHCSIRGIHNCLRTTLYTAPLIRKPQYTNYIVGYTFIMQTSVYEQHCRLHLIMKTSVYGLHGRLHLYFANLSIRTILCRAQLYYANHRIRTTLSATPLLRKPPYTNYIVGYTIITQTSVYELHCRLHLLYTNLSIRTTL